MPDLLAGRTVLVAAHGNSLRAIVKHLDQISDEAIAKLNIPTGIPLRYDLDETCARSPPAANTSTPRPPRRPPPRSPTRAADARGVQGRDAPVAPGLRREPAVRPGW